MSEPENWPGKYEQVSSWRQRSYRHVTRVLYVVGVSFILLGLWVFWRVLTR